MRSIFLLALVSVFSFSSAASDHIDGVPDIFNGQTDLTDLYAFPTPGQNGSLTVIINSYAGAPFDSHFSSEVNYEIALRQLESQSNVTPLRFYVYQIGYDLNCQFTDPPDHINSAAYTVSCQLSDDLGRVISTLSGPANLGSQLEILSNDVLKIYAGPRADPFFISLQNFTSVTNREGFVTASPGSEDNLMYQFNVLSLAVEINLGAFTAQTSWAISAQSIDATNGTNFDRVGRPEITNLTLHDFSKSDPLKVGYNRLPHFGVAQTTLQPYLERLSENIVAYDQLDHQTNWSAGLLTDFVTLLADDFLTVDLSQACDESNHFLLIEKNLMLVERELTPETDPELSCGGRHLTDDIMASLTAYYIGGILADPANYSSGVNSPYQGDPNKTLSKDFPYMAGPYQTSLLRSLLFNMEKLKSE